MIWLILCTKSLLLEDSNYIMVLNATTRGTFSVDVVKNCVSFLINYTLHCSTCSSRLCFQLLQNVTKADKITYVLRTSTGINRAKTAPSYRCCEQGGISFLLYFSKQCLVGNIKNIFKKKIVRQRLPLRNRLRRLQRYSFFSKMGRWRSISGLD